MAGLEEIASGEVTKYLGGTSMRVGMALSCLINNGLGSISAWHDTTGVATFRALYTPYGVTSPPGA